MGRAWGSAIAGTRGRKSWSSTTTRGECSTSADPPVPLVLAASVSRVSPPVALAGYAAASIAEAPIMKTSVAAFRFSLVGFTFRYSSEERFYDDDPMETFAIESEQVTETRYKRADGEDWEL